MSEPPARQPGLLRSARLCEDPRELPAPLPALFELRGPVRPLEELPFQLVPEPSVPGGEGRSRGGSRPSRLCSVGRRTGTFRGRHLPAATLARAGVHSRGS